MKKFEVNARVKYQEYGDHRLTYGRVVSVSETGDSYIVATNDGVEVPIHVSDVHAASDRVEIKAYQVKKETHPETPNSAPSGQETWGSLSYNPRTHSLVITGIADGKSDNSGKFLESFSIHIYPGTKIVRVASKPSKGLVTYYLGDVLSVCLKPSSQTVVLISKGVIERWFCRMSPEMMEKFDHMLKLEAHENIGGEK